MKLLLLCAVSVAAFAAITAFPSISGKLECLQNAYERNLGIYEDKIKALIEQMREKLREGIPEKNIPPMDPFQLHNFNLHLQQPYANLDWNMTEGNITGFLGFELTHLKFKLAGFRFEYGFNIPEIVGKGLYSINGDIMEVLPVYGGGSFDVLATNLSLNGNGKIGYTKEKQLIMEEFNGTIDLAKFKFDVTGLMDDTDLNKLLSELISDSLPDLLRDFHKIISAELSKVVIEIADEAMKNMTFPPKFNSEQLLELYELC